MEVKVTYWEEAAVTSVNEIEGSGRKPGAGGNIMNLEVDVIRRGPRGNWRCIKKCEHATELWCVPPS